MKTTEAVFKRNYSISPLTMEHMHLQVTKVATEEWETTEDLLLAAQKEIEDYYAKACERSQSSQYNIDTIREKISEQPLYFSKKDETPPVSLMEELSAVDDLEILKSYRFTVKNDEEKQYYEERIKTLTK